MGIEQFLVPVIMLVVTIGIVAVAFSFTKKMTERYISPLERIANALEEISKSLKNHSPK